MGIGAVAAALLVAGGLGALQAMTVAAALPFAIVLVVLAASFMTELHADVRSASRPR